MFFALVPMPVLAAVVSVADFGARTCDAIQTKAFQAAVDACHASGGGEVIVPKGIYRIGGLRLRSNVTLHLMSGAIIEGSENPEDYNNFPKDGIEHLAPKERETRRGSAIPLHPWQNSIIRAVCTENVGIIGEPYSYIDGKNCYNPKGEEKYRGPHGINFFHCTNVVLKGYTIRNTGNWANILSFSKNIEVSGITVYAGHDGIDFMVCENVNMHDCEFDAGDDALAGFGSKDVRVSDCILNSSCSAIRFGGTDVVIERCRTTRKKGFGFRGELSNEDKAGGRMAPDARHYSSTVFLYYCDHRFGVLPYRPGNVIIRDCVFDGDAMLFRMPFSEGTRWSCNEGLRSITFENCILKGADKPVYCWGDPKNPIELTLKNVTVEANKHSEYAKSGKFFFANNFKRIKIENSKFSGYTNPTLVNYSDNTDIEVKNSTPFTVVRETAPAQPSHHF